MRLARFRHGDRIGAGVLDGDRIEPFVVEDATSDGRPRRPGATVGPVDAHTEAALIAAAMARAAPPPCADSVGVAEVDLLAPVGTPPSIRDFYAFEAHVATARGARGLDMDPDWYELPVFYFTNPAAVVDPGSPVAISPGSAAFDYELEVAAVIGREAADVAAEDWLDVVAGFCVMNDWSARDLQMREMAHGLGPAKGKDSATSLGPILVTPDELPDVAGGRPRGAMVARVNGEEWSRGELSDIAHSWGDMVAHAARGTVLRPGDVLGSGTVGTGCILELSITHGSERYPWLAPGDEVALEVEGIGVLTNLLVASR